MKSNKLEIIQRYIPVVSLSIISCAEVEMSPDAVARDLIIPTANEQPRYHVLSNKWHDSLILTN